MEVPASSTTYDTTKSPSVRFLEYIHLIAMNYLFYTAPAIGIPGNIMAFLVTMRKENRKHSSSIFMAALSVADTMTLLSEVVLVLALEDEVVRGVLRDHVGRFLKTVWYLDFSFAISSGFILTEMSIFRLIAVRFPMAASTICTSYRAKWTIATTVAIIFALNANMFAIYRYKRDPETGVESVEPDVPGNPALEMFGSMFQLIFGTIVPFAIILAMNIWIIITVKLASQRQKNMTGGAAKGDQKRSQESSHLTRMLILVSCAYVFCSIPLRIYEMVLDIPALKATYDLDSPYWLMRYKVEYAILADLWGLNFGLNFYLYYIGGKKFRKDTIALVKSVLPCKSKR